MPTGCCFVALGLVLLIAPVAMADADMLRDYCIPDAGTNDLEAERISTYPCKSPANVTAADFVFSGIRTAMRNVSTRTGFGGVPITATEFPALNTLGASFARADLSPGGVNSPHYHPRATETALVLAGRVYSGFVDSTGRVFAKVVEKGDVTVFPKGTVHFQMNVGDDAAAIFASFNSQNPGVVRLPGAIFGSGIRNALLEKAFGLGPLELERLLKRFQPNPILGSHS